MKKDGNTSLSILLAIILIFLHSWQYIKSGHQINPLVNLIASVVFIPFVLIFGLKNVSYFLICYGFAYFPLESFDNYTSYFLILSAISLNRRLIPITVAYGITTVIMYVMQGREISHLGIRMCYYSFLYNVYVVIQNKRCEVEPIVVTDDEKFILDEMLNGKEIKEIGRFSQNTIYKKLRSSRERNGCVSNEELLLRYKNQK